MYQIREYITERGRNPFRRWFRKLTLEQAGRVEDVLVRVSDGILGDTKHVGEGVYELRLHTGPGYRIYFGREGDELVILLIGGDKSSQQRDIQRAQRFWRAYVSGDGDIAAMKRDR